MKLLEYLTKCIKETKEYLKILEDKKEKVHSVKAFELIEDDMRLHRMLLNEYNIIYQYAIMEGEKYD